ncbi:MAG: NOP5/NOP56 family protein [Salinirussus sp.]
MSEDAAWFAGLEPGDLEAARNTIETGGADTPRDWPALAIEMEFVADRDEYYSRLHTAAVHAAREAAREREQADDRQMIHALRAMDDCRRTANELAERVAEWAGSREEDAGVGIAYAAEIAERDPDDPVETQLVSLANRVVELDAEATRFRTFLERAMPSIAPNLAAIAGPVLAARLLSEAGSLEALAKLPSGTVQVLGAEDALFAHLQGSAPSPKHGVIYTHEYVRGTAREHRGSAARALAGKLSIAARIDYYAGDHRPEIEHELDERIATIQERGGQ